jgi:hypothetical protein
MLSQKITLRLIQAMEDFFLLLNAAINLHDTASSVGYLQKCGAPALKP